MSDRVIRRLDVEVECPVTAVDTGEETSRHVQEVLAAQALEYVNGYCLTNAIFALSESALLGDFEASGIVHAPDAAKRHGYDPHHLVGLLRYLATQDIVKEEKGETFFLTPRGHAVLSPGALGWLRLIRGGYGGLMQDARKLLDGSLVYGKEITRDGYYTALGSSQATSALVDAVPLSVCRTLGVKSVADLGCGAGAFLIAFVKESEDRWGIGVDIAPEAIQTASESAKEAGVGQRVSLVEADGFDPEMYRSQCRDVELFYSFAMEHERLKYGDDAVLDHIDQMAEIFPGRCYLLGEPLLYRIREDGQFYWVHVLSMQGMPRAVPGWWQILKKLRRARLEEVFVADHQKLGAYFLIRF